MANLKLNFGVGWYDRIEPFMHGTVKPEGIDLNVNMMLDPRLLFDRLMTTKDFDMAEFSISEFTHLTSRGTCPFVALPVFISRSFRHGFICVNTKAGIKTPKDLEGKRIGVPLYTMSAAVWCRGVLRREFGVDLSNVTYIEGAMEKPGLHGAGVGSPLLKPVNIQVNKTGKSLTELLETGEIDATIGGIMPTTFGKSPNIARLFPDVRATEIASYKATGAHPIMHTLVVRREVFEKNPWIAEPLIKAFAEAKKLALQRLFFTGAPKTMLPMLHVEVEDTKIIFGDDPWPDGIEANLPTLREFMHHMYDDGLIDRMIDPYELFAVKR
jgi:4,5-dihydroxyphthalate decarboxylase